VLIYLASPYTPMNGESPEERVEIVTKVAAKLMAKGYIVFSPIVHSHPIADHLPESLRFDHQFWMNQDLPILERCDQLIVLRLPGWDKSKGIAHEMVFAEEKGIRIGYINREDIEDATIVYDSGYAARI